MEINPILVIYFLLIIKLSQATMMPTANPKLEPDQAVCLKEDFSPCSCLVPIGSTQPRINCNGIPLDKLAFIFNETSSIIDLVVKLPSEPSSSSKIPPRLLGHQPTIILSSLSITCPKNDYILKVDPKAIQSAANHTASFMINNCDISHLDLTFLSGFNNLTKLSIIRSIGLHQSMPTLPKLIKLAVLDIRYCPGLDEWKIFPRIHSKGLKEIKLVAEMETSNYEDAMFLELMLNWAVNTSSTTLNTLHIINGGFLHVPKQISSFKVLKNLQIKNRMIGTIPSGGFSFNSPVLMLALSSCQIARIDPGAFQGNFAAAKIDLTWNNLTRFESSVFKPILEKMINKSFVYIDIFQNPIDCTNDPCHLAWLIRDRRDLLYHVRLGYCSNNTRFEKLDPNGFNCSNYEVNKEMQTYETSTISDATSMMTTTDATTDGTSATTSTTLTGETSSTPEEPSSSTTTASISTTVTTSLSTSSQEIVFSSISSSTLQEMPSTTSDDDFTSVTLSVSTQEVPQTTTTPTGTIPSNVTSSSSQGPSSTIEDDEIASITTLVSSPVTQEVPHTSGLTSVNPDTIATATSVSPMINLKEKLPSSQRPNVLQTEVLVHQEPLRSRSVGVQNHRDRFLLVLAYSSIALFFISIKI